jgi:hypothetical protein
MRRITSLLLLCSAFLIRLPAGAQTNIEHNVSLTFKSTGQSIWGPGLDKFNYDLDLTTSWNKGASGGGYFDMDWWIFHLGQFGGDAGARTNGTVGLRLNANASGGTVDVNYPVTVKIVYPKEIPAGARFNVTTSLVVDPSAIVSTARPSVGATLRAVMDMDFSFDAAAKAFGASIFPSTTFGFGIHPPATTKVAAGEILLFDLADYLTPSNTSKTITYPPGVNNPFLTAQLNLPLISTSGGPGSVAGDANSTATTGSALVASLTGNLTNFLTTSLNLPPLNATFGSGGFTGGYHVLNAEAQLSMALKQDFKFVPQLFLTLTATDNNPKHAAQVRTDVRVGDSVNFIMPNNGTNADNTLNIAATVTMHGSFTNATDLLFTGSLSFTPLDVFASGSVAGYTLCNFDFQPFGPFTYVNSTPLPLYNSTFELPVKTITAPGFSVLQNNLNIPRMDKLTPFNPSNQSPVGMLGIDPPATGSNSEVVDFIVESDGLSWPEDPINGGPDVNSIRFTVDEVQNLSAPVSSSAISFYDSSGGHINNRLRVGIPVGSEASANSGYALKPGIHHLTCHFTSGAGTNNPFQISTVRDFYVLYPQPRTDHIENLNHVAVITAPAQTDASLLATFGSGGPLLTLVAPTSNESGFSAIGSFGAFTKVLWNGKVRDIQDFRGDGSQVTFKLLPDDLKDGGRNTIQAVNPAPGGGVSAQMVFTISNPIPVVTEVHALADSLPAVVTAGTGSFKLTFKGTNFVPSSVVQWNGSARATEYVSDTLIRGIIPASDITSGGNASVQVVNPNIPNPGTKQPSGGSSIATNVRINNPVPLVATVTPAAGILFSGGTVLTVDGSNFVAGVTATYNGQSRAVVLVSSTELMVSLLAVDLASLHSATSPALIVVTNPAPIGGASNAAPFQVVYGAPVISGISPNQINAGGPGFNLTVNGGPFYVGSKVYWNGLERPTTVVSGIQLTAKISAADITTGGPVNIQVSNPVSTVLDPASGRTDGGISTVTPFTIVAVVRDVSSQIDVTRGVFTFDRRTGTYLQQVTLTNHGSAGVNGPIYLILSGLGGGSLQKSSGVTSKFTPAGRPYVTVPRSALAGGSSTTIQLQFSKTGAAGITYSTQVVAGDGSL